MSQLLGKIIGAILGIFIIGIMLIIFFGLVGTLVYGFGWSVGYVIHFFVGPDIIFNITFEQLIGIFWILTTIIYFSVSNAVKSNTQQLVEQFKNITKKYRGY